MMKNDILLAQFRPTFSSPPRKIDFGIIAAILSQIQTSSQQKFFIKIVYKQNATLKPINFIKIKFTLFCFIIY